VTLSNDNTGADSVNKNRVRIVEKNGNTTTKNKTRIKNEQYISGNTGGNVMKKNTTGGNITTGDITGTMTVTNTVN
jgi:hypothetical protein